MKVIITMDSGKEYISELDNSIQAFKERAQKVKGLGELDLLPLDKMSSKQISIRHISSVESIEEFKELESSPSHTTAGRW
ncbi:hypothetical protein COJ01_11995 [Priestia megaterium]|uniref:hypothetical protein n=1 Tax=Priestia megaterium TaxID=1404 RepID=UPI000BF78554|nr:hypothetical protein [Priestia megaterium]PFL01176.1 hypothetical protein COJ01_11995 [Priestia megaterium]